MNQKGAIDMRKGHGQGQDNDINPGEIHFDANTDGNFEYDPTQDMGANTSNANAGQTAEGEKSKSRPKKLNDDLITEICGYISLGNYIRTACAACGISYPVFYRWMKHGRENKAPIYVKFYNEVKRAEAELESKVVANWQKQIPYDWHAAKEFLGRRFPKSWGAPDKNALQQIGPDGEPIAVLGEGQDTESQAGLDLTLLNDEEVDQLEKLVRKASKPESLTEGER